MNKVIMMKFDLIDHDQSKEEKVLITLIFIEFDHFSFDHIDFDWFDFDYIDFNHLMT